MCVSLFLNQARWAAWAVHQVVPGEDGARGTEQPPRRLPRQERDAPRRTRHTQRTKRTRTHTHARAGAYAQTIFALCAGPGQTVHLFDGRTPGESRPRPLSERPIAAANMMMPCARHISAQAPSCPREGTTSSAGTPSSSRTKAPASRTPRWPRTPRTTSRTEGARCSRSPRSGRLFSHTHTPERCERASRAQTYRRQLREWLLTNADSFGEQSSSKRPREQDEKP